LLDLAKSNPLNLQGGDNDHGGACDPVAERPQDTQRKKKYGSAKEELENNPDFLPALMKWERNPNISSQMRSHVTQLLWMFDSNRRRGLHSGPADGSQKQTEDKHVFISYSWAHQPVVLKMANELKRCGLKVWFDLDCKCETVDDMVEGLINACAVLVDVSPQYKESANCRTEGQYALQLGIPVIPMRMEANYKANGWLSLLSSGTKCHDFFDGCDFDQSFRGVLKDLEFYSGVPLTHRGDVHLDGQEA